MPHNNRPKGKLGEDLAASYLIQKGYRIIDRNFTIRGGELDLICLFKGSLVFVEVKTRWGTEFGSALEAITPWKLKSLIRTAYFYKNKYPKLPETLRIDLVAVQLNADDSVEHIEHIENISL